MLKFTQKIMNNSKGRLYLSAAGLIVGGISAVGLIAYQTKKPIDAVLKLIPTNSMLNLKQAQLLFDDKYVLKLPKSIRTEEVDWIKRKMTSMLTDYEQRVTVVVGPRGAGTTTAVKTAAEGLPCVITVLNVQPGSTKYETVTRSVVEQIIGPLWKIEEKEYKKEDRAHEVIKAFKQISGGQLPVLIITVEEKHALNDDLVQLTDIASYLSKAFDFNVVIDGLENALPSRFSLRETIFEIKPMSDSMMRQLPQFKNLLDYLVSTGNDKIVLAVCGGCPLVLSKLDGKVKCDDNNKTKDEQAVRSFVCDELREANRKITLLSSCASPMKSVSFFSTIYNKLVNCFPFSKYMT
jgi:hypothetical protein